MFDFLSQKFSGVLGWLKNKSRLTDENISQAVSQVREALIEADVPVDIVQTFLDRVKSEIVGSKKLSSINPGQQMIKVVHDRLLEFLGGKNVVTNVSFQIPSVIMVVGLQGSGKTTTVAKVASLVLSQAKKRGKHRRILLASVDFYRPAAIEQLKILAGKIDVDFYSASSNDPVAASKEIHDYFKANRYELLFLDTAGRLQVDKPMMEELCTINSKLAPKYKFLVLDAMTGQESLNVAKSFDDAIGFDSAILTKMDSDSRGGAAFAFRYALNKPISFVGSGEKIEDLENFIPERMAGRILGMGDLLTLIEKAVEQDDYKQHENSTKRFMEGSFSLKDFAEQISFMDKLGSLQKISRYLPGMGSIPTQAVEQGQTDMKRFKVIISSMTPKERIMPNILDASRKKRIASGSGVNVQDINQLLQRFEQSKQFVKMFKKSGLKNRFFS
jgi:signal recognition particle subunit SRP54